MGARILRLLHALFLFVAALWCGAMAFFTAGGAWIVLTTSTTRHAGGTVNRALLDALDVASYGAVGILFLLFLLLDRAAPWRRVARALTIRVLLVAAVAAFVSHVVITPEMVALRDRMPTIIDLVPKSDPLRQEWGRLHALSSVALLVRIVSSAALFALGFAALGSRPPTET